MTQTATHITVDTTVDDDISTTSAGADPAGRLKKLAVTIHAQHRRGVEANFIIGHALVEARAIFPGDAEYGKWLDAQDFDFCPRTALNYRFAAEHESMVRSLMRTEKVSGRPMGFTAAVEQVRNPPKRGNERATGTRKATPNRHWARLIGAGNVSLATLDREDQVGGSEWVKIVRAAAAQAVERGVSLEVIAAALMDTHLSR